MADSTVTDGPSGGSSMADVEAASRLTVEPQRFAILPEWVLDASISDAAVRLYAVLARYGVSSGVRMPSRTTLATRMGKKSPDSVDRALKELEALGAVEVERRSSAGQRLTNRYHLRNSDPRDGSPLPAPGGDASGGALPDSITDRAEAVDNENRGGRTLAATPADPAHVMSTSHPSGGRRSAATGRTDAAGVAAGMRHNPEVLTQRNPPPPPAPSTQTPTTRTEEVEETMTPNQQNSTGHARTARPGGSATRTAETAQTRQLLDALGFTDEGELDAVAEQVRGLRRSHGMPVGRWATPCVRMALHTAVHVRGWPPGQAIRALLTVAADPETRSPMRLAEAGPWWDEPPVQQTDTPERTEELTVLEARLDAVDGLRIHLQRQARDELRTEGLPLTRATVLRRACSIMDRPPVMPGSTPTGDSCGLGHPHSPHHTFE